MERNEIEKAFLLKDDKKEEIKQETKTIEKQIEIEEETNNTPPSDDNKPKKKNKKKTIIICVLVAIFLAVGGFFAYKYFNQEPEADPEFNQGEVEKSSINYFENNTKTLAEWQAINPEVIGILKINGREFPVCYGQSQDYYLHHDVWGNYDIYGTTSLDEKSSSVNTPVKIVYGHSTTAYSLGLTFINKYFKDTNYCSKNPTFVWEDENGEHTYNILAGLHFENGNTDYMNWYQPDADELSFDSVAYIQDVINNATKVFSTDVSATKPFMLLATCDMNTWISDEDGTTHRYVLVAQEISDEDVVLNNEVSK